jgi:hypothetical protein
MVYQLLPGRVITTIATWVVVATFCHTEKGYKAALTIINVVNGIQTVVCLVALLQVYMRLKEYLAGSGAMTKFAALKVVVFVQLVQRIVFSALLTNEAVQPTTYISYSDWSHGIPEFVTVCEMVIFSIVFVFAYSWKPYVPQADGARTAPWPVFKALFHAINIGDLLYGLVHPFRVRKMWKRTMKAGQTYEPLPPTQEYRGYGGQQHV